MAFKIGQATHITKICTSLQRLPKVDLKNQLRGFTILEKSPLCSWKFYNLQFIMTPIFDSPA